MSMNMMDLYAIQECMLGYKQVVKWLPVLNEMDVDLKQERINTINHVIDLCDNEMSKLSEAYRNECD